MSVCDNNPLKFKEPSTVREPVIIVFPPTSKLLYKTASSPKYNLELPEMSPLIKTSELNDASPLKYNWVFAEMSPSTIKFEFNKASPPKYNLELPEMSPLTKTSVLN